MAAFAKALFHDPSPHPFEAHAPWVGEGKLGAGGGLLTSQPICLALSLIDLQVAMRELSPKGILSYAGGTYAGISISNMSIPGPKMHETPYEQGLAVTFMGGNVVCAPAMGTAETASEKTIAATAEKDFMTLSPNANSFASSAGYDLVGYD